MKQKLHLNRPAMVALSAFVASATAPVFAQDVSLTPPPPVVVNAPPPTVSAPPPVSVAPPPAESVAPPPAARPAPQPAAEPARTATRAARPATRAASRPAAPASVRRAAPAPAPAQAATSVSAPVAAATTPPAPAPVAVPAITGSASAPVAEQGGIAGYWPWMAAAGVLLLAALTLLALRRRSAAYEDEVYYEEPYYEAEAAPEPVFERTAPVTAAAPVAAAAPVVAAAAADEVTVAEPASEDMEALAAASEPVPDRPWLEFLMRPIRAGTSKDDAVVAFELTVGNTGAVEARDVKISTWMVAGGTGSEMERSLIEPPADAQLSELDIPAGDGARVEAELAVPKHDMTGSVLPVVVADARYRLPDGSEGRTHASFAVGRAGEGELEPFLLDRTGITENVEARLQGEPERV